MTITEGKNREVRRVLEYLGLKVSRLIRTAYGPFELADLPRGAVAEIRQLDVERFRKGLNLAPTAVTGNGEAAGGERPRRDTPRRPRAQDAPERKAQFNRGDRPANKRPAPAGGEGPRPPRKTGPHKSGSHKSGPNKSAPRKPGPRK
jgi:23S rRNA pseudouridine2605 synthase